MSVLLHVLGGAMLLSDEHVAKIKEVLPGCEYTVTEQPTVQQLERADYILGNPEPELIKHCKSLKLLQLLSAGADAYTSVMPEGAVLTNATGAYGLSISEHMTAMLLSLMRSLHHYRDYQSQQLFQSAGNARSIYGSTALILGLGDIGGEFARRIKSLGGYTIGVRRVGKDKPDYLDELHDSSEIDSLLPRADILAMSLPNTPATQGILSRERIWRMKKGSFVLNVGRGSAIDQDAMCDALEQGQLAGAGIDVMTPEPLPAGHRLWTTPNLILTPHVSGGSTLPETVNRAVNIAIGNFEAMETGGKVRNQVDMATGYRKI